MWANSPVSINPIPSLCRQEIILIYLCVCVESAYHIAKEFARRKKKSGGKEVLSAVEHRFYLVVIEACFPLPVWILASVEAWMPGVKWNKCLFGEQLLEATAYLSHVSGICIWLGSVYLKMCSHLSAPVSRSKCVYRIAHHRPILKVWGIRGWLTHSPLSSSLQPPKALNVPWSPSWLPPPSPRRIQFLVWLSGCGDGFVTLVAGNRKPQLV